MKYVDESISNLISVWKNLTVLKGEFVQEDSFSYCHVTDAQFKNRVWINDYHVEITDDLLQRIRGTVSEHGSGFTLSVWSNAENTIRPMIINNGYMPVYQQFGMYYQLPDRKPEIHGKVFLVRVGGHGDAENWSDLLKRNFNYNIAPETIVKANETMPFYVVMAGKNPVGTVILHGTGETLGVHSLGIVSDFRKRGYADELVQVIIDYAMKRGYRLITLQSTAMGMHVYKKAGFTENYLLSHYAL